MQRFIIIKEHSTRDREDNSKSRGYPRNSQENKSSRVYLYDAHLPADFYKHRELQETTEDGEEYPTSVKLNVTLKELCSALSLGHFLYHVRSEDSR